MKDNREISSPPPLVFPCVGLKPDTLLETEWLLTNGLGGFACGTAMGCHTRRYHALLIATRKPPVDRWALLSQVLIRVTVGERKVELSNFGFPDVIHPQGYAYLQECRQETSVTLRWMWEGVSVSQEMILVPGRNTALIRWTIDAGGRPAKLEVMPLVANRDFHSLRRKDRSGPAEVDTLAGGTVRARFREDRAPELFLTMPDAKFDVAPDWWFNFQMAEERNRGHDFVEDLFVPGWFRAETTAAKPSVTLIAGDAPPAGKLDFDALVNAERARRAVIVSRFEPHDELEARLAESSIAFVVARGQGGAFVDELRYEKPGSTIVATHKPAPAAPAPAPAAPSAKADKGPGVTIIAGYPWFSDWGRDTFISLPGLLLAGKRFAEAREVIRTFAQACRNGLIPNRFDDSGEGADYNTVDAPLWLVHAVGQYHRATNDLPFVAEVGLPVCETIIEAYRKGTDFRIRETGDGLIEAGDAGTQLTWMDARCDGVTFTPRNGCPVEISALWHHALRTAADLRKAVGKPHDELLVRAARTAQSIIDKFWDELRGHLADVVQTDGSRDMTLRPNQLFAVSLSPSPLTVAQQQAVVSAVEGSLLTPVGLRTLPPGHHYYNPRYEGGPYKRDSSYHNGTVWAWLLGPYLEALLRAYDFSKPAVEKANAVIAGIAPHLRQACLGQVSEIFDADPPHKPRGAFAQAWSTAELLRIRALLKSRRRVF